MFKRMQREKVITNTFTHYERWGKDHLLVNPERGKAVIFVDGHIERVLKREIRKARNRFEGKNIIDNDVD